MIRPLLDRLDPTRQLPAPMRRYLGLPNRLLLAWLALSGLLLLGPALLAPIQGPGATAAPSPAPAPALAEPASADTGAIAAPEPRAATAATPPRPASPALAAPLDAQLPAGAAIGVSGEVDFTLRRDGEGILIAISGRGPLWLVGGGDSPRIVTAAGALVYRLEVKADGQGKLYDAAGQFLGRLKCETEDGEDTCKLYDAAGNKLNRVKLKGDSFNVYGAGGERLYKGKYKDGAWRVRDEAEHPVLTIGGGVGLRAAALLALPLDPAVRVLLWRHAGNPPEFTGR